VAATVTAGSGRIKSNRRVWLDGAWRETAIHDRADLSTSALTGPVIIEEPYATLLVPAGWIVRPVASGDLVADRLAAGSNSEAA
jgi:N-methylhydantoinase A